MEEEWTSEPLDSYIRDLHRKVIPEKLVGI
jgi:hypothetical protein